MTNEHVIKKDMIESKEIIDVNYDFEDKWIKIKLDIDERFIKYDQQMDITIPYWMELLTLISFHPPLK